jgi:hypothetical protein
MESLVTLARRGFPSGMTIETSERLLRQRRNTGVSPLRRAMRLRGSGRDDVSLRGRASVENDIDGSDRMSFVGFLER